MLLKNTLSFECLLFASCNKSRFMRPVSELHFQSIELLHGWLCRFSRFSLHLLLPSEGSLLFMIH